MSQIQTKFIADLAVTGAKIANATLSLTTKVTGVLPIANGGTNSSAALNNNRVLSSSGGAIVEAAAITASRALISDANGIPTHSTVTSATLAFLDATSSVQTQLNGKASTTLNNLGTTSINADLLPSADSTRNLGSSTLMWAAGFIDELFDNAGQNAFNVNGRVIFDTAALDSVNADTRALHDASASNVSALNWADDNKVVINPTETATARAIELMNGAGSFGVSIKAPALSASYTLTLPTDDGTSNQVLTTNGSGVLSWTTPSSGESRLKETFTLSGTDITNQYIDLAHVAATDSIDFMVKGGGNLIEGASHDYSVSYTGGAGGNTRITFLNDLATGGAAALVATDVVQVMYEY